MSSKDADAIVRLKELQAQISGMRLALTTSCSSCDVESVVNLLKVVGVGVSDTISILESTDNQSEAREETIAEDVQEVVEQVQQPELDETTKAVKQQINDLLDTAVDRTQDLTNIKTEVEAIPEQDAEAIMSLAAFMQANSSAESEDVSLQESKASLSQLPIHFDSPTYEVGDITDNG